MLKRTLLALPLLAAALAVPGCAAGPRYGYVRIAPPPPRVEVYGPVRPGFVWRPGYYAYRGGGYVWVPGFWARPPRPRAIWVPGYWAQTPRGYYWREGHWR